MSHRICFPTNRKMHRKIIRIFATWVLVAMYSVWVVPLRAQQADKQTPVGQMGGSVEIPKEGEGRATPIVVWTREQSFTKEIGASKTPQTGVAELGKNGKFDVKELEDGRYTICVQAPGGDLLDPCVWDEPLRVEIRDGKVTAQKELKLALKQGTRLRLEFDDPDGLLYAEDNRGGKAAIQAGLWLPSERFVPFEEAKTNRKKQVFEVTVPPSTGLRVQVLVHGASFEQVLNGKDEQEIAYLHNPAGFGLLSAKAGLKTLSFVVIRKPAQ